MRHTTRILDKLLKWNSRLENIVTVFAVRSRIEETTLTNELLLELHAKFEIYFCYKRGLRTEYLSKYIRH